MNPKRNDKKGKKGFKRLKNAFSYSLNGIVSAYRDEEAFRQIVFLSLVLIPVSFLLARSWVELILLLLPCFLALCVELINSAIENAIDFTSLEIHPLAKKAKDMGSATQLFALIFWAIVWISYLIDRFIL
ncbi:diacylglycerol kinase [Helicobacter cholecystus]|uniref:Diacylglycerol kinase n=1 Tax=Helicobacter cholecystus TaxID=45498 RepID=A0A3D8IW15_9HELI|nr:diacylglycerol kinase [Helicobacter cholecystus]RDU69467.1 diacylglycerol kinase [Helicobacter cholecystus]VEJ24018.1 diacylglycerol kinase [Helicobacter cholecystus]